MFEWFKKLIHREKTSKTEKLISLLLSALYLFGIGYISPTPNAWYEGLNKPTELPPNIVFPIAWFIIFILLISAMYNMWNHYESDVIKRKWYVLLYIINGFFIWQWSALFFGEQNITGALFIAIALLIIAELMILLGFYTHKKSAYLLMPYLAWLLFAIYLNASIITLN